jgi:hypothetical protein
VTALDVLVAAVLGAAWAGSCAWLVTALRARGHRRVTVEDLVTIAHVTEVLHDHTRPGGCAACTATEFDRIMTAEGLR